MFVQTEVTPNPNSLKFLPGKIVSNDGSFEITKKEELDNELVRNLLSINGVTGVFLGKDFLSINKKEEIILDCLNNLSEQFNLTSRGKVTGDVTLWQQQLAQTLQSADFLSK